MIRFPSMDDDALDIILALIKQMEATLLGLRQLQGYVGNGVGREMLAVLIEEVEAGLAKVRRKLIQ